MSELTIVVYGKENCPWCKKATDLLEKRGIDFTYHNISDKESFSDEDIKELVVSIAPGAKTVPIVLINDRYIGGFKELKEYFYG